MKHLTFIITIFLLPFTSSAQTYIGIDAAANSSHWTLSIGGSSLNYSNMIGWSAGVPVEFNLSKIFNLGTGVRYANKGTTTFTFSIDDVKVEPTLMVNYIEIPFLLKGKFGSEKVQFNPIAGVSAGYGIAGRIDDLIDQGNSHYYIQNRSLNFEDDDINRVNVQLHIGAGATFLLSSNAFFFDIQYLHGITTLSSAEPFETEESFSVTAHGFEFSAGYLFRIGKKTTSEAPVIK
jgi:opacity protein-like surface antigen